MRALPYDISSYLCRNYLDNDTLRCFSRCNKEMRAIAAPGVFARISIDGNWERAENVIAGLHANLDICKHVRNLFVKVFVWDSVYGSRVPDRMTPLPELPEQLRDVLVSMRKLQSLTVLLPEKQVEQFRSAFSQFHIDTQRSRISFPESDLPREDRKQPQNAKSEEIPSLRLQSVERLWISPFMDFLIPYCPSLKAVGSNSSEWLHTDRGGQERLHSTQLINAVSGCTKLQEFAMYEWWQVWMVKALVEVNPDITFLNMDGGSYAAPVYEFIPHIAKFRQLTRIRLASAFHLQVGFYPPRCGNAYHGNPGLRERVREQGNEAEDRVVQAFADACPTLQWVEFSTYSVAKLVRQERGPVQISWEKGRDGK